jgi:hypothetical protein
VKRSRHTPEQPRTQHRVICPERGHLSGAGATFPPVTSTTRSHSWWTDKRGPVTAADEVMIVSRLRSPRALAGRSVEAFLLDICLLRPYGGTASLLSKVGRHPARMACGE